MPRRSRSRQSSDTPDDLLTVAGATIPALAKYRRDDEDEMDESEEGEFEADEELDDEEWEEEEEEEYGEEDLDELEF